MTSATVRVSKPAKRATPWSSCTTMSPVRSSVNERSAPRRTPPRAPRPAPERSRRVGTLGAAAAQQAVLGEDRELQLRRDEALAQRRRGEAQRGLEHLAAGVDVLAEPRRFHAPEVVGGALALAAAGERDDRAVAGAHELLELGLGLGQRARGGVGGLRAQLQRLIAGDRRQPDPRARGERGFDLVRAHIQVVGVRVGERGADVAPVVCERGLQLLLGGDEQLGVGVEQVEQRAEALDRQQLGDVRALRTALRPAAISASSRCSSASSAAGAISTSETSPSERWVNVENQRSDSISTSNMSTRTARSSVAGNTSRSPPRSANCPRSDT